MDSAPPITVQQDRERIMPKDSRLTPPDSHPWMVYISTLFASILAMLIGYNQAIISGAMLLLVDKFQVDTLWQQLIATSNTAGCAFALLLAGYPVQRFGRKKMILASNMLACIGAIISAAAPTKEVVLVGRFVSGIGGGGISLVVPMYISECAPADIRGRLGSFTQCLLTVGIVLSSIIAGAFSGIGESGWRWMFACPCVIDVVHFVGFLFLPESPRWYMDRGREKETEDVLKQLRNNPDEIAKELEDMKRTVAEGRRLKFDKGQGSSVIARVIKTPPVRRALILAMALASITQITGVSPIIFYSGTILKRAGFSDELAIWMTSIPSAIMAASAFTATVLVERLGRKHLFLGAQIGQLIALIVLGLGFFLSASHSPVVSDDIQRTINNATTTPICDFRTCDQCIESSQCGFCYDVLSRASCVPVSVNGSATTGRCSSASSFNSSDFTLVTQACPSDYKWFPVIGSSLYLAVFGGGCGVIFVVIAEVFPLWARGTCSSIATSTLWTSQIVVSVTFLSLAEAITAYGAFWLYAGVALLSAIYIFIFMPETRGVRLEDVDQLFMTHDEKNVLRKTEEDTELNKNAPADTMP
ncbi:proton myo-inositol cotransporter-like [Haliotis cracherodii]|uniref:proton myo-inositol cotransporter-like n=1 Tax=Haliotis cracherodii TaxID=6455 RepID=UPI0039EC28AB